MQLEQDALSVMSWCTQVIDGLLQTEEYARTVLRSGFPPLDDDAIERLTAARMERVALLTRTPVCVITVVLEEAVLRRCVGGPDVMKAQYEHLLACAERTNVAIQVMPMTRAGHAGLEGPLTLIETPESERLIYMECNGTSTLISKPEEVGVFARRCAMITQQALRAEESRLLIEQLAGEL